MKTTYVFIDPATNQLIRKEGCNEYFARYSNPTVPPCYMLYQLIVDSTSYTRIITYKITGYWQEILHIEHINKK